MALISVSDGHSSAISSDFHVYFWNLILDNICSCIIQVVKMLALVVAIFAICWLPYRAMVMYNSFAQQKWDPDWFALFIVFFDLMWLTLKNRAQLFTFMGSELVIFATECTFRTSQMGMHIWKKLNSVRWEREESFGEIFIFPVSTYSHIPNLY